MHAYVWDGLHMHVCVHRSIRHVCACMHVHDPRPTMHRSFKLSVESLRIVEDIGDERPLQPQHANEVTNDLPRFLPQGGDAKLRVQLRVRM